MMGGYDNWFEDDFGNDGASSSREASMEAGRYAALVKGNLDVRNVLAIAAGYIALGGAVLQAAVGQDPTWFDRKPIAARFWYDVACLDRAPSGAPESGGSRLSKEKQNRLGG